MTTPRLGFISALTLCALVMAACSGGGGVADPQGSQLPSGATIPQTLDVQQVPSIGTQALHLEGADSPRVYLPSAIRGGVAPLLTKPIIDDIGSFVGGPIIEGENTGSSGTGVEGIAATTGNGVVGVAESAGDAVYGDGAGNGSNGVYGYSKTNYGVIGNSTNYIGVLGETASANQFGAVFTNTSSSTSASALKASSTGVAIVASSTKGVGILAESGNGLGVDGVIGITASNVKGGGGAGVNGIDETPCGTKCLNYGVEGTSTHGYGVLGIGGPAGVVGAAGSQTGTGLEGTSGDPGALALHVVNFAGGTIMTASGEFGDVMSLDGSGNMILAGTLKTNGTPLISTHGGRPQIENVGDGQLVSGHAFVDLDSTFAAQLDPAQPYHVFVTPEGDSNGLYVSGLTRTGFTVRENHGGKATLAFEYRIVGTPIQVGPQRPHGTPESLLRLEERAAQMPRPPGLPSQIR